MKSGLWGDTGASRKRVERGWQKKKARRMSAPNAYCFGRAGALFCREWSFQKQGCDWNERVKCSEEVIVFEVRKSITTKRNATSE